MTEDRVRAEYELAWQTGTTRASFGGYVVDRLVTAERDLAEARAAVERAESMLMDSGWSQAAIVSELRGEASPHD